MPGLTKSISCNGRGGSSDFLEDAAQEDNVTDKDKAERRVTHVQQSPSEQKLATLFVRKRLDLARQASPVMSHQSSPSDAADPDVEKPLHLETFIKSLSVFSVCSLVLVLASLLLMAAFIISSSSNTSRTTSRRSNSNSHKYNPHYSNNNITNHVIGLAGSSAGRFLATKFITDLNDGHNAEREDDDDGGDVKDLLSAGLALTAFVASASLVCFLVCSMQCFFVSKILDLTNGYDRAYKFIYLCSRSRTFAVAGLFTSIPFFFAGIIVFLVSQVTSAHFTTAVVFLVLGLAVCVVCVLQGYYYWRQEKTRADHGLPVYDSHFSIPKNALIRGSPKRQKELCTMV